MDSFELNKIAAAFLVSLLVAMIGSLIAESLVDPKPLEKMAFVVDVVDETPSSKEDGEKPLAPIGPLLIKADVTAGEKVFKKCVTCHTVAKGEPHKVGPNLWGILGASIAHAADFAYSAVFKEKKETWNYENLNAFLHKPRKFAPGTKMTFVGLANDQERADLIAFLRQQADTPLPLP